MLLLLLLRNVIVVFYIPQPVLLLLFYCYDIDSCEQTLYTTRYFGFIVENFRVACAIMQGTIGAVVWPSSVTLGYVAGGINCHRV